MPIGESPFEQNPYDVNPYEAPKALVGRAVGVRSGLRTDLRDIAVYQKGIIVCILIYLLTLGVSVAVSSGRLGIPPTVALVVLGIFVLNFLVGAVFVFLLAMKVYHPVVGVLMAILCILPCVGLVVLLLINTRATNTLKSNGIEVGFLGANLDRIPT
jgi:hypothetical protein